MGNDGDYVAMGLRAALLMEGAIDGNARLWLASHALSYCRTITEKIGKAGPKSLLSIVKLYEEQRNSGLLVLIWFACIVGCDYCSMLNVGAAKFCLVAGQMVYSNLSSLIDVLMPITKFSGIKIAECKDSILAGEQMFLNGPVYDQETRRVVQRSSRAQFPPVAGVAPPQNPKHGYEMSLRWNSADLPFTPTVPLYEDPRKLPYFPPRSRQLSMIPDAMLPFPLEECSKPHFESWLSARNISGYSSLNKAQLKSYVARKLDLEAKGMYDPLQFSGDVKGICADLHAFNAGYTHATDVPYLNIPRALPLEAWLLWTQPVHRVYMKKTAAFTDRSVMSAWSDKVLNEWETLHMNKGIQREGPARAELRLVTAEATATLSMSSREHTSPGSVVQHFRMAIMPSMKSEYHLTSVCLIAQTDESGRPITTSIVGSHCSCLAGIVGRCVHTFTLLNLINSIDHLCIPTDEIACTSSPCQWIVPTQGPTADIKTSVVAQRVYGKRTFDAGTLGRTTSERKTPSSHIAFSRGYIPGLEELPWSPDEDMERFQSYCSKYQKLLIHARSGRPNNELITGAEAQFNDALGE